MITQIQSLQTSLLTFQQSTCASCSQFKNFHEASGRGWCLLFDRPAKLHHARVWMCELESAQTEAQKELTAEAPFKLGELVKIVDPDENREEWAEFIVTEMKYNPHRFLNVETWLREPSWYCHLKSLDGKNLFVLPDTELCKSAWAHLVNPEGEF